MQNRIKAINRIEEQEGFSDWLGGYTELDLLMYLWEPHDVAVVLGKLLLDKLGVETLREIDRANSETVYGRCASFAYCDAAEVLHDALGRLELPKDDRLFNAFVWKDARELGYVRLADECDNFEKYP